MLITHFRDSWFKDKSPQLIKSKFLLYIKSQQSPWHCDLLVPCPFPFQQKQLTCTWRTTLARRLAQGSSCLMASCISPSAIILNILGRLVLFGPRTIGWLLTKTKNKTALQMEFVKMNYSWPHFTSLFCTQQSYVHREQMAPCLVDSAGLQALPM